MTSKERILAALRHEQPDRVPVTLYEMDRYGSAWYTKEPSYRGVLELADEIGDTFHFASVETGLRIGDSNTVRDESDSPRRAGEIETVIPTPRGPLTMVARREPNMMTSWVLKHYIETREDIDKFLSLEPSREPPNLSALYDAQEQMGEAGVAVISIGDTFGTAAGMFDFPFLATTVVQDLPLIVEILNRLHAPLLATVKELASKTKDALFRFWGPEYCGAPLLNPAKYFEALVVNYDTELAAAVDGTGNFSTIHCHGKLDALLEMIAGIGVDALEPIETLPTVTADVTMQQVKERVGDRLCLMGGMQALDLEMLPPAELEERVRITLEAGSPGGGFVLLPTAMPVDVPLPDTKAQNVETYLRAGRKYGSYA
jgi:uroporphyrinogen decarboxylase